MKKDQPTFTLRQVGIICERLLKDYEDKIREEYEQILNTRLAGRQRQRLPLLVGPVNNKGEVNGSLEKEQDFVQERLVSCE